MILNSTSSATASDFQPGPHPRGNMAVPSSPASRNVASSAVEPEDGGEDVDEDEMELIKRASRKIRWTWNEADQSAECLLSEDKSTVCFHPDCSESAAACRGSRPLTRNGNYYYWELLVLEKCYGTSVMFGLCTGGQPLHVRDYCNLIGLDQSGWSLSHKGLLWHGGQQRRYTDQFPANRPVKLGLMFNTMRGELSYFMEGRCLGVAFAGLNTSTGTGSTGSNNHSPDEPLWPVVGSTAKCTRIQLLGAYCGYVSLLERSCFTLVNSARDGRQLIHYLETQYHLPRHLVEYLARAAECRSASASSLSSSSSAN